MFRKAEMKKTLATLALVAACGAPALADPVSFDVMATALVPAVDKSAPRILHNHIGVAVGPRFGGRIAIVPLVNITPFSADGERTEVRYGGAVVYALSKRVDFGAAMIQRPEIPRIWTPAVAMGIRL